MVKDSFLQLRICFSQRYFIHQKSCNTDLSLRRPAKRKGLVGGLDARADVPTLYGFDSGASRSDARFCCKYLCQFN